MKKFNLVLAALFMAVMSVTFLSCKKENEVISNPNQQTEVKDIEVKDGILHFKNDSVFSQTVELVTNMSDEEFRAWEKSLGFTSLKTIQDNALDELEYAETEDEVLGFVTRHADLFEIVTDQTGEKELVPMINSPFYPRFINADGIYLIKKLAFKVVKYQVISTDITNVETLQNINQSNIELFAKERDYSLYNYSLNISKNNIQGDEDIAENGKKRVKLQIYAEGLQGSSTYRYRSYCRLFAQKKVAAWVSYKPASLTVDNLYYTVYFENHSSTLGYYDDQFDEDVYQFAGKNNSSILCSNEIAIIPWSSLGEPALSMPVYHAVGYSSDMGTYKAELPK